MSKLFKRTDWMRSFKLGKGKRKVAWRRPTGTHSKIRRKRFGYPSKPTVGHRTPTTEQNLIKGVKATLVRNVNDLSNVEKGNGIIIARVGAKKKMDIIKKAQEMKVQILNMKSGGNSK